MKRRDFLKHTGVAVAASATASCAPSSNPNPPSAASSPLPILEWRKAPCRFCGTGCGVEVAVDHNKIVAVRGDQASPVNRGLLCAKGYHLPAFLYASDRLTHPQLKKPDGTGYEQISWDRALDLIAKKYQDTLDQHGPQAVGMYGSGQWTIFDGYAALKWVKAGMRSNNLEANARLCMASAVTGFMTQFQSDEPMGCYDDFEAADDFVLWGNNMAENHPVLFSRMLERRRTSPGTRIIDLAPRRTPTSHYADLYVEFKPGTDLALANGILHLLVEKNKFDPAFLQENVVFKRGIEDLQKIGYGCYDDQQQHYTFKDTPAPATFDDFRQFLRDYTPERVAALTGIPAPQIHALADLYGDSRRSTLSLWCMGVNQHTRGTWMNNLITNLHLLTGKISRPGNNPFSLTGQPSACGTVREVGTLCDRLPADMTVLKPEHRAKAEQIWKLPPGTIPDKPGYHTVDLFRAFIRGDVKTLWIQTTNPWVSLPNLNRFQRKKDDGLFLIVSDIYPTPTTAMADLILPSAAWVEREGMFGNTERRTQHWDKMIDPPGEAREDAWQIIQVARKMGYAHLFPWTDDKWHKPLFEEYRQFGLGLGKDLADYDSLRKLRGARWPVVGGRETRYRYAAGFDPYVKKSAGVHFYKAHDYGDKAAIFLRPYHPPAEAPDKDYPFWLTTGRVLEHWHTGSMTSRIPQLHQAVPRAYVEMNPADAQRLGFQNGQTVKLVSRRGTLELPVMLNGPGTPSSGSLFVPFFDEGRLVNRLTIDAMDNISKEPDYKKTAVRVEKV